MKTYLIRFRYHAQDTVVLVYEKTNIIAALNDRRVMPYLAEATFVSIEEIHE